VPKLSDRGFDVKEMTVLKHTAVFAAAVLLALAVLGLDVPNEPSSIAGSWQVDTRHSDAKLITDARTRLCKLDVAFAA
jgi:hypothetical protein